MKNQQEVTDTVTRWILSTPVLTSRLRMIARDGAVIRDDDQELMCTVTDLLDPERKAPWPEYLHAVGAPPGPADQVWQEIGGITGIYAVHWDQVRRTLMGVLEANRTTEDDEHR